MLAHVLCADGDGTIDNREFIILTVVRIGAAPPQLITQINERFRMLDRKREGRISYDDLVYGRKKPALSRQNSLHKVLSRTLSSSSLRIGNMLAALSRSSSDAGSSNALNTSCSDERLSLTGQWSGQISRGVSAISLHSMHSIGSTSSRADAPHRTSSPSPLMKGLGRVVPVDMTNYDVNTEMGREERGHSERLRSTSNVETFEQGGGDGEGSRNDSSSNNSSTPEMDQTAAAVFRTRPVGAAYRSVRGLASDTENSKQDVCAPSPSPRAARTDMEVLEAGVALQDVEDETYQNGPSGGDSSSSDDDIFDYALPREQITEPVPGAATRRSNRGNRCSTSSQLRNYGPMDRAPEKRRDGRRHRASVLASEKLKAADTILTLKSKQDLTAAQRVASHARILITDPFFQSFLAW